MNGLHTENLNPPNLANKGKCDAIKEEIIAKINLLSDEDCADLLYRLNAKNLL